MRQGPAYLTPLAVVLVLGLVATLSPIPKFLTDKDVYEQMSREWVIPNCDDLQCFRVLVPITLGFIPIGSGYLKWRAYAVVCEAVAAVLMGRWVRMLGASHRASQQVTWLTALGAGSLYTLFDPFTADPLMHAMGPLLMVLLFGGWILTAALVAAAGVFGKEFAAVPLFVAGVTWLQQRRIAHSVRALVAFGCVVAIWSAWQLSSRAVWNYAPVQHSGKLLEGAFLAFWLANIGPALAVVSIAAAFGALWILWPAGVAWGTRELRQLTVAAMLPLLFFNYVQQPDRALWNFAFAVMPAAAVVLDRIPAALGWLLVAVQALLNLRIGAQLPFVPPVRATLVAAMALGLVIVWRAWSAIDTSPAPHKAVPYTS
ncbi:MAG: hypothetical protein Q7R30_16400 [Acidobacteriota bacterium]|nr:hypothetical protein [Acidobacteriota bacterium]